MRWVALFLFAAIPASAASRWTRVVTPQFELYTTAGEKKGRETIRRFEQVREFFLKASPVRATADFPSRIVEFATEEQFRPYQPNAGTSAYFFTMPGRDYIVLGNRASVDYSIAIHEYMHLIVEHSGSEDSAVAWLNEELGRCLLHLAADGQRNGHRRSSGGQDASSGDPEVAQLQRPDLHRSRLPELPRRRSDRYFLCPEAGPLAHMLYLSPEYKDNFGKFVMALHRGNSTAEAVRVAWDRTSGRGFSRDLNKYLDRKQIYGRIFEAGMDSRQTEPVVSAVPEFDARLMLVDLLIAGEEVARSAAGICAPGKGAAWQPRPGPRNRQSGDTERG